MSWSKPYTIDFGPTGDNIKQGVQKNANNIDDLYTHLNDVNDYSVGSQVVNLQLSVNAAVNKLDIFAKSSGSTPDADNTIRVAIPDGTGFVWRTRAAAFLSGTSQFVMADAANYWSKGSLDAEIKNAYVYAIWNGTGIIWALAGYSGFNMVPTTTTVTDDDYFLLEASSTYTRSASHYCVCVGRIRYQYDTGDTPDHTIQATVENSPRVIWNPKSDYGYTSTLATTVDQLTDIAAYNAISITVKQKGIYYVHGQALAQAETNGNWLKLGIKIGTTLKAFGGDSNQAALDYLQVAISRVLNLLSGDVINLNAEVHGSTNHCILLGDSTSGCTGATSLTFQRID